MNRLTQPLSGKLSDEPQFKELVSGIRVAEENHASRVRAAIRELAENLREKTGSNLNLGADVQNAIERDMELFESRINGAELDWIRQREWLASEIDSIEVCRNPTEIYQEMARAEVAVADADERLEGMLKNNTVSLANIMRYRIRLNELKAYLRGLHFQAGAESIFDSWTMDPDA